MHTPGPDFARTEPPNAGHHGARMAPHDAAEGQTLSHIASWQAASAMQRVATARAVHALEATQTLDDAAAVAAAAAQASAPQLRVQARAWLLAQDQGLPRAWRRLRRIGLWAWLAVVALIMLAAWGMAGAVMGEGARINLLGALVSLLGMNALMLVAWLVSVGRRPSASVSGGGGVQQLVAWGAKRAGQPVQRMLAAAVATLAQVRASAWLAGLVSHSAWALGFALILVWMGFGFAFRRYQPVVETTILSPQMLQALVDGLGWLPAQLGTAKPVLGAVAPGDAQRGEWAWWLMVCVFWYGLVPRALLTLVCALVLRRKLAGLALPEADAGYQWALARFKRLQGSRVLDADASIAPSRTAAPGAHGPAWGLLLYELPHLGADDAALWRKAQVALAATNAPAWAGSCDGGALAVDQTRAALAQLAQSQRLALVLVVNAAASPDRSVGRFVRMLLPLVASLQLYPVWPVDEPPAPELRARWRDWLQAQALEVPLLEDPA